VRVYAVDIGATAIKQAVVDTDQCSIVTALPVLRLPPTATVEAVRQRLFGALIEPDALTGVDRVAIATTGAVDEAGMVVRAGGIQGYSRVQWQTLLATWLPELKERVHVINDGMAATWAEYQRRGGTGNHVHFTLGSGIGGGIAIGGRLVAGPGAGPAGPGHILVDPAGTDRCSCSRRGCVETLASGRAIRLAYQRAYSSAQATPSGRNSRTPTLLELAHLAQRGNPLARRVFEDAGHYLGVATASLINVLNPETITVGGGLALAAVTASGGSGGYLAAAQQAMREHAVPRLADAHLELAAYGSDAELIGAALLATGL